MGVQFRLLNGWPARESHDECKKIATSLNGNVALHATGQWANGKTPTTDKKQRWKRQAIRNAPRAGATLIYTKSFILLFIFKSCKREIQWWRNAGHSSLLVIAEWPFSHYAIPRWHLNAPIIANNKSRSANRFIVTGISW